MINKDRMPVVIGVAFVWFTTQFGGGFASGAQLKSYFVNYGIWCLIMPLAAQAIAAFYQWYTLRFAHDNEVYDYRSFNDKLFGKFRVVFSNLYEFLYLVLLCVAPSVAFATGGSTMNQLLGVPYLLCTAVIGVFIFVVAIFGTNVVRKVASTLSVLIILGLLVIFIPNIITQWGSITANIGEMAASPAPFGPALWSMFVYACFQLASIGLQVQHARPFTSAKQAFQSQIIGFFVNGVIIMLSTLGLLAIVSLAEYAEASVPVLVLVQNGVGGSVMTPIISILIILGAVSTAVNMIAGVTTRICSSFDKEYKDDGKPTKMSVIVTLVFTLLAFCIAQFGLLPLIQKGYGVLGYLTIPIVMIPFVIHMIVTRFDAKAHAARAAKDAQNVTQ